MALRYIAPALAVAGTAAAACSGTTTISNSAQAAQLSTCYTYSGDIAIATGTTDDIALDGVRRITGSLMAKNVPDMSTLSGDSLSQIDDSFSLNNIQTLSTLNFPMLQSVDTVDWVALPGLGGLSFTAGLTKVSSLSIDNTNLQTLDGIDLIEVDTLTLANNIYLNDITMPLGNVSSAMVIHSNGDKTNANFPNLEWAYNISLADCQSANLQSLQTLNGSLGFYSNTFSSLSMPNLTIVGNSGGGLSFVDNNALTNISVPSLKLLGGGLTIANNTKLTQVDGFPRLSQVQGAVDCNGNFKNVQMPDLTLVRGAFNLQSRNDITSSCNRFHSLKSGRASPIRGPFTCEGSTNHPGGTGTLPPGTNNGGNGGSASSSSGAANPVYISGATGVLGVLAAIFGML